MYLKILKNNKKTVLTQLVNFYKGRRFMILRQLLFRNQEHLFDIRVLKMENEESKYSSTLKNLKFFSLIYYKPDIIFRWTM